MPSITIEIFPAKYGESFLVTCHDTQPFHILIDMGFSDTYNHHIKKRLIQLKEQGHQINLLVFTHIDIDHIQGGISFLKDNGKANSPNIIGVDEIWYNGYRHIAPGRLDIELEKSERSRIEAYSIRGMESGVPLESEPIGGKKGSVLGALILEGNYEWNKQFGNSAVYVGDGGTETAYGKVNIQLLSPELQDLVSLETVWKQELIMLGFNSITSDSLFDDAFEVMISDWFRERTHPKPRAISDYKMDLEQYLNEESSLDNSLANASSISFIVEFNEKKVLFSADAFCSRIYKNLLRYGYSGNTQFDAIKVAHHGGSGNTDDKLLSIIDSPIYILSTNGNKYDHPDLATIANIVCRETAYERSLIVNYKEVADKINCPSWTQKYRYKVNEPDGNPVVVEI